MLNSICQDSATDVFHSPDGYFVVVGDKAHNTEVRLLNLLQNIRASVLTVEGHSVHGKKI